MELGAIVDSQGFIALVVNKGSAAQALSLRDGDTVILERDDDGGGGRGRRARRARRGTCSRSTKTAGRS